MYGKVFSSIFDGSLHGQLEATITMIALVTLADKNGVVDITIPALAARTGFPLPLLKKGLDALAAPDSESRSKEYDGRRIVPFDPERTWGWLLVNYSKYRGIRSADDRRDYMREYMTRRRRVNSVNSPLTELAKASASSFDLFWSAYPKKVAKRAAQNVFERLNPDETLLNEILKAISDARCNENWISENGRYIPYPATWLNARRWEDENLVVARDLFADAI